MTQPLFLVVEGELWHHGYVPHVIHTERDAALSYANELKASIGGTRWANVYVYEMRLGEPGAMPVELDGEPTRV